MSVNVKASGKVKTHDTFVQHTNRLLRLIANFQIKASNFADNKSDSP